ncbi:MAG TPA: hypothetical protein VJC21_00715 [Candidatus Nanoarchaeia archaeon]|nr:hypothetical protein [Candidatus Nanoarchaeia archaeon]
MDTDNHQQLIEKYKAKIRAEFGERSRAEPKVTSREYQEFKKELYPTHYSLYEKACNFSEKILRLKVDPQKAEKLQKDIVACHLNITPSGVLSFAILLPLLIIVSGALVSFAVFQLFFFVIFFVVGGLLLIPFFQRLPSFMATTWRMKSSAQMIESIFYLVTYMRHTSNLERAIGFAADHLDPPLSLDFRKMLWDVETEKYSTIKNSADAYLEQWKESCREFVEAFHLIEGSLFEPSEERRLSLLDKALDVILDGTYENMLHYAHSLQSPMTMLHMLGVVLPILGLVILPLVVSFMGGGKDPFTTALYIAMLYNVSLPIGVYYLGKIILAKRPAGYGATDIGELPGLQQYRNVRIPLGKKVVIGINPFYFSSIIFIILLLIGLSPLIMHALGVADFSLDPAGNFQLLNYICPPEKGVNCLEAEKIGPFGMGAALLSLVLVAGLGTSVGLYYSLRSKNVIKIREKTRALEDEFSSALFQLGNRLGDGLPAEIAFARVAQSLQGTTSGEFFTVAERNMTRLGMGIEQALFDPKVGALASFPSRVIESSMKVLAESIKKGPRIAAQALLSMSRYIKEIHRVEERLKDLMSEVISSMKSQIKFLTPAIAGIVVGITAMISSILTRLSAQLTTFASQGQQVGGFSDLLEIFGIGMPTYHFQIIVGIYIVQIIFILTVLSNGIENGADKLSERFQLGRNLVRSTLSYCLIAGMVMILFNLFASNILKSTLGT